MKSWVQGLLMKWDKSEVNEEDGLKISRNVPGYLLMTLYELLDRHRWRNVLLTDCRRTAQYDDDERVEDFTKSNHGRPTNQKQMTVE